MRYRSTKGVFIYSTVQRVTVIGNLQQTSSDQLAALLHCAVS